MFFYVDKCFSLFLIIAQSAKYEKLFFNYLLMSCYVIYYENGAKMMRPVLSESEYRALRGSEKQRHNRLNFNKNKLVQMNYSCVPSLETTNLTKDTNLCGALKGCTTPSNSVGMDVDFDVNDPAYEQKMKAVPELVLSKKEELGLLMLERSVRKGYHIVFRRRPELSQEENLRWASELLGVQYDEGAKDITRVFFTTTDSAEDLIFLDPELFEADPPPTPPQGRGVITSLLSRGSTFGAASPSTPSPLTGEGWGVGLNSSASKNIRSSAESVVVKNTLVISLAPSSYCTPSSSLAHRKFSSCESSGLRRNTIW